LQKEMLQSPAQLHSLQHLGKREQVLDQLIQRAYTIAFDIEGNLPRDRTSFEQCLQRHRSDVVSVAQQLQDLLYRILQGLQGIRKKLTHKAYSNLQALPLREDVERQLQQLVSPDFLRTTAWLYLQQFPRYLQAIELRLDKYPLQVARDKEWSHLLGRLWHQYEQRRVYCERQELVDEALDEYRWLLEELRVSLFAQALGTRVPVSEKRLQKFWQEEVLKQTVKT
jgi:ATP-dependent helicase HrpA